MKVARQTVDCLLLSFDRLPIDLGGQTSAAKVAAAAEGKWVYLFVTKATAKAATSAAATVANGICNAAGN